MHLCRSALQRLAPLTHRSPGALLRNGPVRQMSSSSVPGSSGEALPYYLLVGVSLTGAGIYVYRTLSRDRARFNDRHEYIQSDLKPKFEAYGDKSEKAEASEVPETIEEAVEAAIEEAAAEAIAEQEVVPTASQEQAVTEEATPAPTEQEQVVTEEEPTPAPTEQEQAVTEEEATPAPSSEAATVQVEQENIEPTVESSDVETSPLLEASSDNIPEEVASAAEDWSELSARKPEEGVEEISPEEQESDEMEESEKAAASS